MHIHFVKDPHSIGQPLLILGLVLLPVYSFVAGLRNDAYEVTTTSQDGPSAEIYCAERGTWPFYAFGVFYILLALALLCFGLWEFVTGNRI